MSDTEEKPMEGTQQVEDEGVGAEEKPKRLFPVYLTCRLCSSMYKRAVKLPCCGFKACRGCAVKYLTANNKCWNPKCTKAKEAKAKDLVNDDNLRARVEKRQEMDAKFKEGLKTGEILKCPVCEEVCKRGVTLPCCGAWACRGCAVKQVAVKRGCWLVGCETIGITNEDLKNDELLRGAVDQFKNEGLVDEEQARQLIANKNKLRNKNKAQEKKAKKAAAEKKAKKAAAGKTKKVDLAEKKYAAGQRREPPKQKVTEEKSIAVTVDLYVAALPQDVTKETIKEAFEKFGKIEQVNHFAKLKTATVSCANIKTANSILEQKGNVKIGESAVKIELNKSNKCADWILHLTGMPADTSEEEMKDLLEKYGVVKSIKIGKLSDDKPFAHVVFEAALSVRKLVNEREIQLDGQNIKVALKNQKLRPLVAKVSKEKSEMFDNTAPLVTIKGIFLKKDEAAILKLFEQFGNIEDSKFFTKAMDTIPPNVGKLVGKEKKKIMSKALIKYKKHNSALNAINKEKVQLKGRDIFINHKVGSGPQAFKTKLEKAAAAKKARGKPEGGIRRVIGFNTALKRDSRGMWQNGGPNMMGHNMGNMWKNGGGPAAPPFHKDLGNVGRQGSFTGMSGGRNFLDEGSSFTQLEMKMRKEIMKASLSDNSFFEGYEGEGPNSGRTSGDTAMNGRNSAGAGWRDDDMSGGLWSRRGEGVGMNGSSGGRIQPLMGSGRGGLERNGGIDMRGESKFNQDFSKVTGMGGGKNDTMDFSGKSSMRDFTGKSSMFDSGMGGMSSGFDLRATSSMNTMKNSGFGSGYGIGGSYGSRPSGMGAMGSSGMGTMGSSRMGGMGSNRSGGMGRMGGMGSQNPWSSGSVSGRFSDMDQLPSKIRRY